jgi:hypothetical protein
VERPEGGAGGPVVWSSKCGVGIGGWLTQKTNVERLSSYGVGGDVFGVGAVDDEE